MYFHTDCEDAGCIHFSKHTRQSLFKTALTFLIAFPTRHAEQHFPFCKSDQEAKAIPMRQTKQLKRLNTLFLRIWVLVQYHQDMDYNINLRENEILPESFEFL